MVLQDTYSTAGCILHGGGWKRDHLSAGFFSSVFIDKLLSAIDCFVMGCRLALLLDDLLWVLTDSQLKAALCFIDSLSGLIKRDTEITRVKKAARKLEVIVIIHTTIYKLGTTKVRFPKHFKSFETCKIQSLLDPTACNELEK